LKRYEFKLSFFDRIELRTPDSAALAALNELGAQGWRIVHVREDPQHARDLAIFLEREIEA
jgi:hypothetical protein